MAKTNVRVGGAQAAVTRRMSRESDKTRRARRCRLTAEAAPTSALAALALAAASACALAAAGIPLLSAATAAPAAGALKAPVRPPKAGKDGMEVFLLPPGYRNADGSFNQEAIVAQQKRRLDVINEKLGLKMRMTETPHYLVLCDADAATAAQFVRWSEALYASLCAQFGIDPKERVWDGKCMLLVFRSRAKFVEFARVFDSEHAADAGAFFAWEHYAAGEPECVHIAIPLDERDPKRLQELFAHEGTHAFFQLYRRPVELPLWLHEGLAEYMTVVNDPDLRGPKTAPAVAAARLMMPLDRLFKAVTGDDLKIQEYSIAFTLVDYLQQAGKTKFKQFVVLLKDGKDQDAALKAAYGFDTEGLARRWRAALAAENGPPKRR
ncbi:MAG: hypothetical protein FJ288_11780 [Planctomycetes bacterium]|nr:hypothetical protein [Planctomycetota bacterium]